jgi:predicted AAA+ superfamily ATPase
MENSYEGLFLRSQAKVQAVPLRFKRYLLKRINWNNRLIAIKGARGSGKTTLLLQFMATHMPQDGTAFYVAMDDLFFTDSKILSLAEDFAKAGGTHLLLDEVHKYPGWSREIKLIYDNVPELHVIFTSSSILEIYAAESDLSRRAISYELKELSFREFIALEKQIELPELSLSMILKDHVKLSKTINEKIKPIALFTRYVQYGAYPYFVEDREQYLQRLLQTVNLIIDVDLNAVEYMNYEMLVKIKKLLKAIASSVPFTPNISKLSEKTNISRPSLLRALHLLERARLILSLKKSATGTGAFTKPEKLYLNNSNLLYALAMENVNTGTIRETFFINQLQGIEEIHLSKRGDFLVAGKYIFEIGGKNKTQKQIKGTSNAYLAKDNIEYGISNIIPLWMFGFLY